MKSFILFWWTVSASHFHLITPGCTWEQAREFCGKHYVDLAVLSTEEQYHRLQDDIPAQAGLVWLGFKRDNLQSNWKWVSNEELSYRYLRWYRKPDGYLCGSLTAVVTEDRRLLGRNCEEPLSSVCQGKWFCSCGPVHVLMWSCSCVYVVLFIGSTCAVVGCTNNTRKLKDFTNETCFQHKTMRWTCCPAPYALHSKPKDATKAREWLAALKLKYPLKKPTELNPNPELFLGYERPSAKKRRTPIRCEDNLEAQASTSNNSLLYTGITLQTFDTLVSVLENFVGAFKMSLRDQVLLTLMKLRLNLMIGDLSRRFFISESLTSKIISYWIDKLEEATRDLIPWLPRETIRATMPPSFKIKYPKTTCILDCSESLLQKAKNLDSRGESYSHYYSHNTAKYLVSIAPCGLIMFISVAYGGRCSDKFITMDSWILDYLQPGDEVMADRGFTIRDILLERKINLVIPSFTKKKDSKCKNTRGEGHQTPKSVISQVVPISLVPKFDNILRICSALVNLRGPVGPQKASLESVGCDHVTLTWNVSASMRSVDHAYSVTMCGTTCDTFLVYYTGINHTSITINLFNLTSSSSYVMNITATVTRPDAATGKSTTLQSSTLTMPITTDRHPVPRDVGVLVALLHPKNVFTQK
ncbi:hypothetical protein N1851_004647 [Merluccius polli]|uniref:C-type lectin domain-containing protein n=1 Tax=Merluccius polli TaxID=89951 RepID=A0AA47N8K8_MERPO|nr:hypothetical protein N1851_004647 [Merluccius polli]